MTGGRDTNMRKRIGAICLLLLAAVSLGGIPVCADGAYSYLYNREKKAAARAARRRLSADHYGKNRRDGFVPLAARISSWRRTAFCMWRIPGTTGL